MLTSQEAYPATIYVYKNSHSLTWDLPFPLTIRQVEVSVKVTSMVRYSVTNLLSWSMSGCKSQDM